MYSVYVYLSFLEPYTTENRFFFPVFQYLYRSCVQVTLFQRLQFMCVYICVRRNIFFLFRKVFETKKRNKHAIYKEEKQKKNKNCGKICWKKLFYELFFASDVCVCVFRGYIMKSFLSYLQIQIDRKGYKKREMKQMVIKPTVMGLVKSCRLSGFNVIIYS